MLVTSWLQSLLTRPARRSSRGQSQDRRAGAWSRPSAGIVQTEQLEDRTLLSTFYVDNAGDFVITIDQGAPGLDAGDEVTWNSGGTAAIRRRPTASRYESTRLSCSIGSCFRACAAASCPI